MRLAAALLVVVVALASAPVSEALNAALMHKHIAALRHGMAEDGKLWALLVAGSNGWDNYRHQADICHAYQILHKNGVPDENIVVMMYDDIASNIQNKNKGQIINEPNGPDVYAGVPKDYTRADVTPANFLKILQGQPMTAGSKKVIKSGPNDRIFVVFADHGAPGLIAFPTWDYIISQALHSKQLLSALSSMYQKKQYEKMTLYIEACESGSMFDGLLPNNTQVYAVTAASPFESSYACYYDKHLGVYLGDCFSNHWMEDADKADLQTETLQQQWQTIREDTNTSVVCQYGDLSFLNDNLATFMSVPSKAAKPSSASAKAKKHRKARANPVNTRDIVLATLQRRLENAETAQEKADIQQQIKTEESSRAFLDKVYAPFVLAALQTRIGDDPPCNDTHCYDECIHAAMLTPEQCYWQCCIGQRSCVSAVPPPDSYCLTSVWRKLVGSCGLHVLNDYSMKFGTPIARVCALDNRKEVLDAAMHKALEVCTQNAQA